MYLRLKTVKNYEVRGEMKTFRPGDWLDVPKQTAMLWIGRGEAEVVSVKQQAQMSVTGCGVVITGQDPEAGNTLRGKLPGVQIDYGEARCAYQRTLIWSPGCRLRLELVPIGFHLLDTWEMVLAIADYHNLADKAGKESDREETKALIHDLRVPYYDSRLVYVRRCDNAKRVIELWRADVALGKDSNLSLLRAVYKIKPLVLSLPVTWVQGRDAY